MKNTLIFILTILISISAKGQTVVSMEKVGGVYTLPCSVNGIKMKFIFDTGASDVSISKTEAEFLIKQGLLTTDDFLGTVSYQIADGTVSEGLKVNLKEIKIRDLVLKNVTATIVKNSNAPLLLGQSALSQLGKIEILQNRLVIYPVKSIKGYEFLGIDLTQNIGDFGLSRVNLTKADPYLPILFEHLNVPENHFLEKFNFDKQSVVFNKQGNIEMVGLQLKPIGKYLSEQDDFAKENFTLITEELNKRFWLSENRMARFAEWKSSDFQIVLNIEPDHTILLFYRPLIIRDLGKSKLLAENLESTQIEKAPTQEEKLAEARKKATEALSMIFVAASDQVEIRCSAGILQFHYYETFYGNKPSYETMKSLLPDSSFDLIEIAAQDKEIFQAITEIYESVTFNYHFDFIDAKNVSLKNTLNSMNFKKLEFPLRKWQFKAMLE